MRDFVYQNTTRVIFGKGRISALGEQIPAEERILLIAGGGSIKANGVYSQVREALAGRTVVEHWGIEPNPDISRILPALELVGRERTTFLLAVGGGSVVDATKCLALLARNPSATETLFGRGGKFTDALPLGVVLTAPGTGSEMNSMAAISSRATSQKIVLSAPSCQPRFAILDPEVTYSLPPRQLANGIVDAYVHVLEQYLTYEVGGILSNRLAEAVLLAIRECAPKVMQDPHNYEACANLMWCSTLALNGLVGVGVPQDWSTHYIGHELTAIFGIEHARTLAAVLPAMLHARFQSKADKLLQYGSRILGITTGTDEERARQAIEDTRNFFESLGVPTRLTQYGLTEESIPRVVANLKAARRIRMGERLDINLEQVAAVIKSAL